jgi:hypothetical protein
LGRGSSLIHAGLDPNAFGVTWDPYHFANDSFLNRFFDATPTDFYGNLLPPAGSKRFSLGANQVGTGV